MPINVGRQWKCDGCGKSELVGINADPPYPLGWSQTEHFTSDKDTVISCFCSSLCNFRFLELLVSKDIGSLPIGSERPTPGMAADSFPQGLRAKPEYEAPKITHIGNIDAALAYYLGDTYKCRKCGNYDTTSGQRSKCVKCGFEG